MESDPERKRLEEEFYDYVNITQDDNTNEYLQTSTPSEADRQPDILQQLQSVCLLKWKENDGNTYEGTGFLAKIKIGSEVRIGFFTAGHNILQKNKKLVNFNSMKLNFKHIGEYTNTITLAELLSKLKSHVIVCAAYKTKIFIKENGQKEEKVCKAGVDFCSILFTSPVDKITKLITKMGFNYLEIAEQETCGPAPDTVVTLVGFPQFLETKKMRILPGKELPVTLGNLPDNIYTIETAPDASGGPINKNNGEVKAIHIRGKKGKNGDLGNKGLSFDSIRDELVEYFNCVSSDVTSDRIVNPGALSVVTLRGIGMFRFFIIMTACFSIVSCQTSHQSDRYVSLSTGFQVSKNYPKNSTITLPSNMKNSCQLGLIITVKSEQPHSEEEHLNETGNIRFFVSHPNLPESQEEFEISSNEVEFRWKKILHNLCFTNCENIQERTVFLRATTYIAGVKNITITSVRGGDPCEENEKASSDPWKIPAIISIIIAFLVCLFAIILVIKVPARKSSFKALPTDDRQQKVVEIKLPVS